MQKEQTSESQFECEWMAGKWFYRNFVGTQMYSNFNTLLNDFIWWCEVCKFKAVF